MANSTRLKEEDIVKTLNITTKLKWNQKTKICLKTNQSINKDLIKPQTTGHLTLSNSSSNNNSIQENFSNTNNIEIMTFHKNKNTIRITLTHNNLKLQILKANLHLSLICKEKLSSKFNPKLHKINRKILNTSNNHNNNSNNNNSNTSNSMSKSKLSRKSRNRSKKILFLKNKSQSKKSYKNKRPSKKNRKKKILCSQVLALVRLK